jgi:hypothetical protein
VRRASWLGLVVAAVVVPAALAASTRERQLPGTLSAVSAAGHDVAYADEYRPGCHEVRLWDVGSRADRRLASHCFVSTSTGSGVAGVEATYGRALWLTYTGGNIREWSLWTKGPRGKATRIAFLPADVDEPAPVVLGRVWIGSLPYAVGRTIVVLAPNGSRRFTFTASDRVVAVSASTRGYAAVLANGHVLSISLNGRLLSDVPYALGFAEEAVLTGPGLVVKTREGVEIHDGTAVRRLALPRGARFLGFFEGVVAYGTGRQLRLLKLSDGKDVLFRTLAPRFRAQLGISGLAYASGRTLGFNSWGFVRRSL